MNNNHGANNNAPPNTNTAKIMAHITGTNGPNNNNANRNANGSANGNNDANNNATA